MQTASSRILFINTSYPSLHPPYSRTPWWCFCKLFGAESGFLIAPMPRIDHSRCQVRLREEIYSTLGRTMFQRVRIAGRVLPGSLLKIQHQDLPSFLYASKRCSTRSDHRLCFAHARNNSARPRSNILHRCHWDQDRCRSNHCRHRYLTAPPPAM
jgi:hypothetical protein